MIPSGTSAIGKRSLLNRTDLISIILRLQHDGWAFARANDPSVKKSRSEPYMNGRLFLGMTHVRDTLKLTNMYLVEIPGARSSPNLAVPDREPDIIMLFMEFGTNEPHAIIECKRVDPLQSSRALRGEYIRSGVDRFTSGSYGAGHDLDFMVGYLLRGNGADAVADINSHLENVGRKLCCLKRSKKFSRYGYVADSTHKRKIDGSSIKLIHSFLGFE